MPGEFRKTIADQEVEKNFALARMMIDDIVALDMDINYPGKEGNLEVAKYEHGSEVAYIKCGFRKLYEAPRRKRRIGEEPSDDTEPSYYLDGQTEKEVASFLSEIPDLAKYLAKIQDERYKRVVSALNAYSSADTGWHANSINKIKGYSRLLTKKLEKSRVTLEEVKTRKQLADTMVTVLFELVDVIVRDLEKIDAKIFYTVPKSKDRIRFSDNYLSVDINGYPETLYKGDGYLDPSFSPQDVSNLRESEYKKLEEAAVIFVAQLPAIYEKLDNDQKERLKKNSAAFEANTGK